VAAGELETLKTIVVENMSNVVELSVPLEVQIGIGSSWDAAGH
jgi:DNA polymerase-1